MFMMSSVKIIWGCAHACFQYCKLVYRLYLPWTYNYGARQTISSKKKKKNVGLFIAKQRELKCPGPTCNDHLCNFICAYIVGKWQPNFNLVFKCYITIVVARIRTSDFYVWQAAVQIFKYATCTNIFVHCTCFQVILVSHVAYCYL